MFEECPTEELFRNPLHPYTKTLLSSVPVIDASWRAAKKERTLHSGRAAVAAFAAVRLRVPDKMSVRAVDLCSRAVPGKEGCRGGGHRRHVPSV
ncbi:MAG: hypothetical protein ACLU3I_17080 [Acutalibacteraceae bacterium]